MGGGRTKRQEVVGHSILRGRESEVRRREAGGRLKQLEEGGDGEHVQVEAERSDGGTVQIGSGAMERGTAGR